jgi:hypothetical protein
MHYVTFKHNQILIKKHNEQSEIMKTQENNFFIDKIIEK